MVLDLFTTLPDKYKRVNVINKKEFVNLLSTFLKQSRIPVEQADEDANELIVKTAIRLSNELSKLTVVVGNDVDLFVLLIDQTPLDEMIYFYKMGLNEKKNQLFSTLNNKKFRPFILFAHAFSGCDTTSAFFKQGKRKIIALLEKNSSLVTIIRDFYKPNKNLDNLHRIAEKNYIPRLYLSGKVVNKSKTIAVN
ncbi:hypothetical protein M0802_010269 [Mischocyttarus mexicanus]|nr:hypothetical protein M0802_010269 [Mischocyttarus mexicanus]